MNLWSAEHGGFCMNLTDRHRLQDIRLLQERGTTKKCLRAEEPGKICQQWIVFEKQTREVV